MPLARIQDFSGTDKLYARKILQELINVLVAKRKNNEALMEDMEFPLTRLLFFNCASVIQDCIEITRETARKHGITMR